MTAPLKLTPIIEGNVNGDTIIFIQGWPDNASLWDDTVASLRSKYRCVRLTMPNFDGQRTKRWGYTTEEIVDALTNFVRDSAHACDDRPVTLVLHDWGSYWGHPVHHRLPPELVTRVVGVDVAPHFKPSPVGALGIVAYQSWLFWAFMFGSPVGDWMTRAFAKFGKAPNAETRPLTAWMNYPYRNTWADLLTNRAAKLTKGYWPECPILFIYGEKKPFHFHSANWVAHVKKVEGGEVIGLPSGHWAMNDPSFTDILLRWLEKTKK